MTNKIKQARNAGYDDYKAGKHPSENPYRNMIGHKALSEHWLAGWSKAERISGVAK